MIRIHKGREPRKWTEYCNTPGVHYKAIPKLREALLKEQGYICAYCMRRIPVRDKNSNETSRIDHVKSQEKYSDLELKYSNMVICCPGAISEDFHCDKLKEEEDVTFDLFSQHFIDSLFYSSKDGEMTSSNAVWDGEIRNVLNLNNEMLKKNRLVVIEAMMQQLGKKKESWTLAEL